MLALIKIAVNIIMQDKESYLLDLAVNFLTSLISRRNRNYYTQKELILQSPLLNVQPTTADKKQASMKM